MAITKIITPDLIDLPFNNTDGIVLAKGTTSNGNIGTTSILNFPTGAGCIAAYQFESDGASTGSSSNNQTTVGTLTYSSGNFGNAVSGFGSGKYFETAGLFDSMFGTNPAREISFSVWIKTSSSNSQYICGARVSGGLAGMNMGIESNKFQTQISAASGNSGGAAGQNGGPYARSSAVVNDGNWHNLVSTYKSDGTTSGSGRGIINQYIDGVKVTSTSSFLQSGQTWTNGTANPWSSTGSAFYTGTYDATYYQFAGQIDQLRLYNKQLTDAQVLDIFDNSTYVIGTTGRPTTNLSDGEFRYNTTTKKVEYYDGADWFALTSSVSVPQAGTTTTCNYPTTATALYQLQSNDDDTCGNYDGTGETAITYTPGKFGNSATFSGNGKIILPSFPSFSSTGFTISLWIKTTDTLANAYILILNQANYALFNINRNSGSAFSYYNGSWRTGSITVRDGNWHNIVVAISPNSPSALQVLYVDGVEDIRTTNSYPFSYASGSYNNIGTDNGTNPYTGQIAQLRIFPSVLTQEQVTALATETAP